MRTVLGDLSISAMGICYSHEHIIIDRSLATHRNPDFLLNDVDRAVVELSQVFAAGGRTMVDSMPCGCGRNASKLAEVSRRSAIHILCPTGLHHKKYYPPGHWAERFMANEIADIFVNEIEHGIDANDTNGPHVERTQHRAGLIKVASGLNGINDYERKVFEAAAIAQISTGVAILTHAEQGTAGLDQAALLSKNGVHPNRIVISHTDRKPEVVYHRELLSTGVFLEYDSAFRWKSDDKNPTRELLETLCYDGYSHQLLVGMDAARQSYWRSYGGSPGLTFILDHFFPDMVRRGFPPDLVEQILVLNPARAYAISRRGSVAAK
jgi:5-phospho-D-xylono-1,4-lactonase